MNIYSIKVIAFIFLLASFSSCSQQNEDTRNDIEYDIYPKSDIVISTHTDFTKGHYPKRIEEFKKRRLQKGDIVFLGNSITEQGGNWKIRLNNPKAKNRGIAGDTTEGILARLGELYYFSPNKVFILIGINDLFHPSMNPELIVNNINEIVKRLKANNPNTIVYVQTVLPTTSNSLIEEIKEVNVLLENLESKNSFELLKIHHLFALENGTMNMEYSNDGIHLNEKGYEIWSEIIKTKL